MSGRSLPKSPININKGVEETPVRRPISPDKISEIIALLTAELKNKGLNEDVIEIIINNYFKELVHRQRKEWAKKTKSKEKIKSKEKTEKTKSKEKIINKSRNKE